MKNYNWRTVKSSCILIIIKYVIITLKGDLHFIANILYQLAFNAVGTPIFFIIRFVSFT